MGGAKNVNLCAEHYVLHKITHLSLSSSQAGTRRKTPQRNVEVWLVKGRGLGRIPRVRQTSLGAFGP